MFGIGLPEMIVILAVALIVVGPDKLPDLARSVAKGVLELKKTLNQVKDSLADEDDLIGSVKKDLHEATGDLKDNLIESDHFTFREPPKAAGSQNDDREGEIIDAEVRPWEKGPGPEAEQVGENASAGGDISEVQDENSSEDAKAAGDDPDTPKV